MTPDLRRALAERDAEIAALRAERDHLRSWVLATASNSEGLMALLGTGTVKSGSDEEARDDPRPPTVLRRVPGGSR
jgi:hypothetical protein